MADSSAWLPPEAKNNKYFSCSQQWAFFLLKNYCGLKTVKKIDSCGRYNAYYFFQMFSFFEYSQWIEKKILEKKSFLKDFRKNYEKISKSFFVPTTSEKEKKFWTISVVKSQITCARNITWESLFSVTSMLGGRCICSKNHTLFTTFIYRPLKVYCLVCFVLLFKH